MRKALALIAILAILAMVALPASAAINVSVTRVGVTYIMWQWPDYITNVTGSVDGVMMPDIDPHTHTFSLTNLKENETHTLAIYTDTDSGTSTASTLPDNSVYVQTLEFSLAWVYILLAAIMFLLGAKVHWLFYWFGSGISLYALYKWIQVNTVTTTIESLQFWIYLALFITGLLLWMMTRKRSH